MLPGEGIAALLRVPVLGIHVWVVVEEVGVIQVEVGINLLVKSTRRFTIYFTNYASIYTRVVN